MTGGPVPGLEARAVARHRASDDALPTGLVTFAFTDIEGSTGLLNRLGDRFAAVLQRHRDIIRTAVAARGGHIVNEPGDAVFLAFGDPVDALLAMRDAQLALAAESWPAGEHVRVRVGLHSDEAVPRRGDYVALGVHQAARISAAAHGGQVLASSTTAALARSQLPSDTMLVDLGSYVLRDFASPERLHQLVADGLVRRFAAPRTASVNLHNLPLQRSSFIGRDEAVADLREAASAQRLVTVTGAGGVGKTRLAVEVAGGLLHAFPDGVWLAELATVHDGEGVVGAVGQALGLPPRPSGEALHELVGDVGDRRLLLVLDNCEHVVAAAASIVDVLLRTPGVHVLATSREPLGVYGEVLHRVPSLSVADSIRLFADRAVSAGVDVRAGEEAEAVVRHLDGIPLAVELAAAATSALGVRELAARLDDRFRLLPSRSPRALPRHRTLRALVEWSHDLLGDYERVLFRRMSVFVGGCTLAEAERTCAGIQLPVDEVVVAMSALVDKSLVQVAPGVTGVGRYSMLETLRLFGAERLAEAGEEEDAQHHHLDAMATFAAQARRGSFGPDFSDWLRRCDEEAPNIAAALAWSLTDDAARLSRLAIAAGMASYWNVRGTVSVIPLWRQILADAEGLDVETRLQAEVGFAGMLTNEAEPGEVRALLEGIVERHGNGGPCGPIASALATLAWAYANEGRIELARDTLTRSMDMATSVDDAYSLALGRLFASNIYALDGDHDAAIRAARDGIATARKAGISRLALNGEIDLGWALFAAGDLDGCYDATVGVVAASREARSPGHEASARLNLGHVHRVRGELALAAEQYADGLVAARAAGSRRDAAETLEGIGMLAADAYPKDAAALFGAADRLRTASYPLETALVPAYDEAVARVSAALGSAYGDLRAAGHALTDDDVDALVASVVAALADL